MKVLFLDIDGVLNSVQYFKSKKYNKTKGNYLCDIDTDKLPLIQEIIEKTHCKVVLSSSWRYFWNNPKFIKALKQLKNEFKKHKIVIFDITGFEHKEDNSEWFGRQLQIRNWLQNHTVEKFCILDDDTYDLQLLKDNLVNPSFYEGGIKNEHVEECIKILNS